MIFVGRASSFQPLQSVITCGSGGLVPGGSSVRGSAGWVLWPGRGGRAAAAGAGTAQALSCGAGAASVACAVPSVSQESLQERTRRARHPCSE